MAVIGQVGDHDAQHSLSLYIKGPKDRRINKKQIPLFICIIVKHGLRLAAV